MSTVLSTAFTGSNGAAWPAPWTTVVGTATIQTNRGQLVTAATQWTDAAARANLTLPTGRVEVTARFPTLTGSSLRINIRYDPSTGNGYRIILPGDYSGLQLLRIDAWTETELDADWTLAWAANTDYRVAFEFDGPTLRAKRWVVGAAEPSTWHVEATDATHTTGDVLLQVVTSTAAAATALWDDVLIADAVTVGTPTTPPPVVGARSAARVGFHNDAFLAPSDDYGTFNTFTSMDVAGTRAYLAAQTALGVPMVGESAVANGAHSQFPSARSELETFHWTALNPIYHPDVLASWSQAEKDEAARNLGYRLRLVSATLPTQVGTGSAVAVTVDLVNDGYAAPYRERPVQVIFSGANTYTRDTGADLTAWGTGAHSFTATVAAPPVAGTYAIHLSLPDPSPGRNTEPAYSIQFANVGTWDAATGWNSLRHDITVQ